MWAHRGQCLVGSLAGAAHLSKSNAGVPRSAQAERKSAVEQKGKSRLDRSLQCGRRPRKRGLSILLNGVPSVEQEVSDKLPQGRPSKQSFRSVREEPPSRTHGRAAARRGAVAALPSAVILFRLGLNASKSESTLDHGRHSFLLDPCTRIQSSVPHTKSFGCRAPRSFADDLKENESQMWLRGGRKHRPRVSSPYATAGKLARLQCFPCRDLEVFFQIFSKSQMSLQGGEKGPSTGLLGPGGREGRPATAFFPP
ncbi:hypothetical protein P5673_023362 [Acropora cervicornis]|uniref:Uncharacterized protein n=1 Tax=Acropora cervicornis TaxID=6130 RepID=A0AAD9UYX0_ACRCE|nr:hypothetical protein P5673_023362 [Acropora cervicornis]